MAASWCNLQRAAAWLVDAAGGPSAGIRAVLARQAVLLAYGRTFRVWLDDDTPDCARTLAELDKSLGRLEAMACWACRAPGRRREDGSSRPEPAIA